MYIIYTYIYVLYHVWLGVYVTACTAYLNLDIFSLFPLSLICHPKLANFCLAVSIPPIGISCS